MKILVVDPSPAGALAWIMRCLDDGHEVRWYAEPHNKKPNIGKGIAQQISDWRPFIKWADLIFITDNIKYLRELDAQRRADGAGKVVGATVETALWERDRAIGMQIMKQAGIEIPPYKIFDNYDKAMAYVKKENGRYVSKPCGDATKDLSYVAKSGADLVYMLERWKKHDKLKQAFMLQKFIPGIEMAVGGWFGPGGFNRGWCENWEFKKLMNDDLGVATGEQGTVLRYVATSALANKVLKPLEEILARTGYTGYIDVNCIIDDEGTPWPLEFTMRPGWPTFNIQQAVHKGDHAQWLLDLANGVDAKNVLLNTVAVGVVMTIPDYPYSHYTKRETNGIPLYGLTDALKPHVHLVEMQKGEAPHEVNGKIVSQPCLVTAGDYVLEATGTGETVLEAKKKAYSVLKQLSLPNSPMYRTDISNRLKKQLPKLQAMGYATGMSYA